MNDKKSNQSSNLTNRENDLLNLLREDPAFSISQMAERLSVSRKTIAVWIKSLKSKAILIRVGNNKTGYWEIHQKEG